MNGLGILLKKLAVRVNFKIDPHPDEVDSIPSRDADRTIKVHVYRGQEASNPSPVLIDFCGSGFMLTSFGPEDEFCRYIAHHTGYTVIERRRCIALAISSFSPTCRVKESDDSLIRSVICFSGVTDVSVRTTAKKAVQKSSFVIRTIFPRFPEFCHSCHRNPSVADLRDPRLSPLYADPARFPMNLLIGTAAQDPFTLEGEELAGGVRRVGGHNVVCHRTEGCEHGWDKEAKRGTRQ
ncbi:uncharacterized protein ACLA_076210 [Aspergillus clavatus NRRL 1]|uniref:Alpha/beta hydrolase fold-3 domain-containing protein n=1 Tax=Aspergillus clavatus (strain ATCC 1007 / CBS 513.65 / DSM 816 / NCTC 3887 / NRRL 1 / QM 1276 / 107) TaxID=344612 RepID=A1C860_ASPCL|nr:uncharacterized protein ACLA_076210 [Aspergillus clavatus NRRL 1]EAW14581.1 hypothetical protein ACLA_076210 [Aspergillus clavatus NRRL 1]